MAAQNLRIDFSSLAGRAPAEDRAYLFVIRTDTTDRQAPIYSRHDIFNPEELIVLDPSEAVVSVNLIPNSEFTQPTQYILRIGEAEIAFTMPDEATELVRILYGEPPPHPSGATFYLAASPLNTLTGPTLIAALQAGTASMTREPIAAPTFTGNRYLYFAQPLICPISRDSSRCRETATRSTPLKNCPRRLQSAGPITMSGSPRRWCSTARVVGSTTSLNGLKAPPATRPEALT